MIKLKELRKKNSISQIEIAKYLNIPRSTYSNYENGYAQPDNQMLVKIADYFNVTTDYLLGRTEIKNPYNYNISDDYLVAEPSNDYTVGNNRDLSNKQIAEKLQKLVDELKK